MSAYTQILYQIVFSTKYRKPCLLKPAREQVFAYMMGIAKNRKCHPFVINGVENHVHILTHLHPSVSLSSLVKDIKIGSHIFIDENKILPGFSSWQAGYAAFTYSKEALPNLIRYIENQEAHHRKVTFEREYRKTLEEQGVKFDERYLFE